MSTRRKTSLHGPLCGNGRTDDRNSSFKAAHSAIIVGPDAPARTVITAIVTTEASGCLRLISDRGFSSFWKYAATSSSPNRFDAAVDHPHAPNEEAAWRMV